MVVVTEWPDVLPGTTVTSGESVRREEIYEEIYQQPVMEAAVAAAFVLAHDTGGPEARLGVTADDLAVGGRRVGRDPVLTALAGHDPGGQPDRLAARRRRPGMCVRGGRDGRWARA